MPSLRFWIVVLIGLSVAGCSPNPSEATAVLSSAETPVEPVVLSSESIASITAFCGDCHAPPLPDTFPKSRWPAEVLQGYRFYEESERDDLVEPIRAHVIQYYQSAAPDEVLVPPADQLPSVPAPIRFRLAEEFDFKVDSPTTANLHWEMSSRSIVYTNMQTGELIRWQCDAGPDTPQSKPQLLAAGEHLCRVNLCDWNADGIDDFLLGEMGSFSVADHDRGKVLLQLGGQASREPLVLAEGLGRTVEAKPFDYDEDGDIDILVAEFGWRKTGSLRLLKNIGGTPEAPQFESLVIDPRHGVLAIEIADNNGDGKLDFVTFFSQEFESIEINTNRGNGNFERSVAHTLPDPSYNASGLQVVDLDQDGRLDIVYTCGDVMDAFMAKPYHGVGWVRNLGGGRWENRWLGLLVGALASTVADFDGDGDLDVAAVGMFPGAMNAPLGSYDSICWWEQQADLNFVRHSIERDLCSHAACTTGDVNQDGRIDLIVGEWMRPGQSAFHVFLNEPAD